MRRPYRELYLDPAFLHRATVNHMSIGQRPAC
jgi:hypothetical protein